MATTDEVLRRLGDVHYPAGKDDLLAGARAAGADEDVLKALRAVPPDDYANSAEVARALPTAEPTDARTAAERARRQSTSHLAAGEREVPPDPTDA
ncbi:DUF2795 domain-containing protein [Kineococcus sp. R8]|uniref:DUF2795 domain-containing protein n=1 Tax=Kineococcus siccus TaxID=2696567 RepID=UPI0014129A9B|nr:DUF2795 domain-containing protein [Kineococcus siccus]NAZ82964.1 DUF2795 domain-containing protein [Kineococcus siccus]